MAVASALAVRSTPDAITCIGKASQSYRGTKLAFADAPTIGGTFGR